MAFNEKEQELIRWGLQNGKSRQEIDQALIKVRSGFTPSVTQPKEVGGGFFETIKDIPGDLGETFSGSVEATQRGMESSQEIRSRVERGETTPVAGTLQTIGAGLRAGAEVVGQGVMGLGKTLTSPLREQKIGDGVSAAATSIIQSKPAQDIITAYKSLSPEEQRNVQGTIGVAEGVTTAFGFAPVLSKLKGVISDTARASLEASDAALQRARTLTPEVAKITVPQTRSLLNDIRYKLSDVDPQVETVLQRSNFDEVNRYFQQARAAKADPAKSTPLELAGQKAVDAYEAIDESRKAAVKGKKDILASVSTQRVTGNTINDVMSAGIQRLGSRFGAKIDADGTVLQTKGRTLQLDASDTKLVGEYFKRLNALGISPTVQQVDDFVDWAQSQLYKQSKTVSKFEVASEPVVRELQGITGDLNTRLKAAVGNGYGEVNARVGRLIELQDELSRALGADARKGGGLLKRLFSPTGGDVRRIFEEIKRETGVDLVKEATLAKFAMEGVGDVRQQSLLKQLDVLTDVAADLDLTKPLSVIKFIRERADLDAQELANEIIRRSNSATRP